MVKKFVRLLIAVLAGWGGFSLSNALVLLWYTGPLEVKWAIIGLSAIISALIGFYIAPYIISFVVQFTGWLEVKLYKTPIQDIVGGAVGLIFGLIIAWLLGSSLETIPLIGNWLPLFASLIFGYLGMSVGVKKKEELLNITAIFPSRSGKEKHSGKTGGTKTRVKILDTSVIIDGRIADICKTGFVEGVLIIPGFVLEELRHIADSSDLLKRNRGRRGLDILNKMRKEFDVLVKIHEEDFDDISEVDSKLVRLAQKLNGDILTNDFNLNKVAELQEVKVLNINELANAVKPVVLPGEEMSVQVIKDGKEAGQGIGYLDDGTMIVVENGRRFIGRTINVLVTSVLQTAAGRMIFAKPKSQDKANNQQIERGEYQCLT
ncbi:PIN/TRAM domain-containing protein [Metallumcola ferriviriculae]|uniref:PIN/TRAM domain-containing protein n=1 Tax=Metallumcola ferriviriculae TaxID=3039180 RepID=A0AAU0UJK1_9FIRM|nr:PIN/TRAM domain-containing protein [Desulfitibacteraceae bacterium MK1]